MKCTKMDRKKLEPSHPVLHMYKLTKTASGQVNYVCCQLGLYCDARRDDGFF
jgi:hypothetical protein